MIQVLRPADSILSAFEMGASLSQYAAYGLGGVADFFFAPRNEPQLIEGLKWAHTHSVPVFVMGSGTNLLVRDGGIRGLVVYLGPLTRSWELEILEEASATRLIRVPGAFSKSELLDWSLSNGCAGLEFSAGIPGTLGGAVFMNAGTRWGYYGQVIERVRIWSPDSGIVERTAHEMGFKYRGHGEGVMKRSSVVLSADIRLPRARDCESSRALVDRILSYRGSRQALERPSCGSVFKNPENSTRGAGRLIESAALKGTRRGGAQLSTKHANFLLNRGNCTAADVEELILFTQSRVKSEFDVDLEPEVIFVGEARRVDADVYTLSTT